MAREIELGQHIKLGRGEETTGGRNKASILSDTVEAVIGAIHLSGGIDEAAKVVHRLFDPVMEAAASMGAGLDWKTSLQELSADLGLGVPEYLIEDDGPDHMKTFVARVRVGEQVSATAPAAPRRRPSRAPPRPPTARSRPPTPRPARAGDRRRGRRRHQPLPTGTDA